MKLFFTNLLTFLIAVAVALFIFWPWTLLLGDFACYIAKGAGCGLAYYPNGDVFTAAGLAVLWSTITFVTYTCLMEWIAKFKCVVGSTLHGTAVQDGLEDLDLMGIKVESPREFIGFNPKDTWVHRTMPEGARTKLPQNGYLMEWKDGWR